jgi:hypothetical protein
VDGEPVSPASRWRDRLAAGGFAAGYRGMALRVSGGRPAAPGTRPVPGMPDDV